MEYLKHTIRISAQNDTHQALMALSALEDLLVVNIADSTGMKPILLTEENLRSLLARAPESLFVEALPLESYKTLMRDKIAQVAQSMLSLRAALRSQYVADLAAQIHEFLSQLEPVLLLLKCYALQITGSGVAEGVRKLEDLLGQLATSSFEHGDNVRCMDDLQYQILPVLNKLLKVFRK